MTKTTKTPTPKITLGHFEGGVSRADDREAQLFINGEHRGNVTANMKNFGSLCSPRYRVESYSVEAWDIAGEEFCLFAVEVYGGDTVFAKRMIKQTIADRLAAEAVAVAFVATLDDVDCIDYLDDPESFCERLWLYQPDGLRRGSLWTRHVAPLIKARLEAKDAEEARAEEAAIAATTAKFLACVEAGDVDGAAAHVAWDYPVRVSREWTIANNQIVMMMVDDWGVRMTETDAGFDFQRVEGCEFCGRHDEHSHDVYPREYYIGDI